MKIPDGYDLIDQIGKYVKKRNCHLYPLRSITEAGATKEQARQLTIDLHEARARQFEAWLDHLEALEPLFETALSCIQMGEGAMPVQDVDLAQMLARIEKEEENDDY
jgi:hypothetical protein